MFLRYSTGLHPVTQIVPIPKEVQKIPGRLNKATNEIVFRTANIPALGLLTYVVARKTREEIYEPLSPPQSLNFISNEVNVYM